MKRGGPAPETVFRIRIGIAAAAFAAVFIFLGIHLFAMQGRYSDYYKRKVADQMTTERTVSARRGSIYSSGGELLATDITKYRVFIEPQAVINGQEKAHERLEAAAQAVKVADGALRALKQNKKSGVSDIEKAEKALADAEKELTEAASSPLLDAAEIISRGLSEITGVEYETVLEMTGRVGSMDATVLKAADRETADRVAAFRSENGFGGMIHLGTVAERNYVYGGLASHLLGFTGTEGNGLYGLELYYNEELSGSDGRYVTELDSLGKEIGYDYGSFIPAEDGCSLHTTIDIKVQSILEEQLKKTYYETGSLEGACGIVMNVRTGAVLAMATYPDFDCNDAWTLDSEYAAKLADSGLAEDLPQYGSLRAELLEKMWSNMAVSYTYIPGSTFKVITSAIALDSSSVRLSDRFTCTGSIVVEDRRVHCSNIYGHGNLTFAEGLQQSCNPWFIQLGVKIGGSTFYDYFENFGYLRKSGIDLPGEGGTLFWSRDEFTKINLAMCAFGQNFKVSPIRHLTSLVSIANGGYLIKPYIVDYITDSDGNVVSSHTPETVKQVISGSVSRTVAGILADGVAGNGGSRNAYVAGYRVAAKTGTSEKVGEADEEMKICSCMAFAPSDDPEIAMIIIVDAPTKGVIYGSTVAAPYVSAALSEILPSLGVEPVYTAAESAKLTVEVGNYTGRVSYDAVEAIEKLGVKSRTVGVGTMVTAQVPAAGTKLQKDSGTVVLYVGDNAPENNIVIPNVAGISAAAARQQLISAGLNIRINGTTNYETGSGAVVFSQSPTAGTLATAGDVVEVTFRYMAVADD